jgi:XapX domain-containing protein
MRLVIGVFLSLAVGAGCRWFDVPVPSPPVLPGAMLVLAMTLGYSGVDRVLRDRAQPATTTHLCGGPTGTTPASREATVSEANLRRGHDD